MAETAEAEAPVEQTPATVEQTPAPVTTEQTPATTEPSDGAEKIGTILAAVEANPALADDPEVKAILELAGKAPKAEEGKTEEPKTEEPKTEEPKAEEPKTEEPKTEEPKTEEPKEVKPDSVFFKEGEGDEVKVELKDLDAFNAHIKEKFSIEDPTKFFSSVDTWRSQAQNAEKSQAELDDITSAFEKMPDALYSAFVNWSKGESWEKAVQGVGVLDFNKEFNEYDTHTIVNHYLPGDFTKEDLTGEEKDSKTVKQAINLAKSRYETDKQAVQGQRATHLEEAETAKELIKTSTVSSVEDLKQAFPGLGKDELKKVQNIMNGGDLTAMFFDKNGGYTKDAARKIAMALFAEKEIANANKRTKTSQAALIDKVDAGNEKPSTTTSTQSKKSAVPEEVSNLFSELKDNYVY